MFDPKLVVRAASCSLVLAAACFNGGCDRDRGAPPSGIPPLAGAETTSAHAPSMMMKAHGAMAAGGAMPPHAMSAEHGSSTGVAAPGGHAGGFDPHAALPPGHPSVGGEGSGERGGDGEGAGDPGGAMPGAGPDFDPKARITGTLVLGDAVKAAVAPGDAIFLVARVDDGSEKGTILGVKRFSADAFPMPFEIDGRDAMFPGTKFAGKVFLSARVDKDGDAITKNAGDVLGTAHVEVPAIGLRLALDTLTH